MRRFLMLLCLALFATPAGAAKYGTYTTEYSGSMDYAIDFDFLFCGCDLTGLPITLKFVTHKYPGVQYTESDGYSTLLGGSKWGLPSPTATYVTIGGVTQQLYSGFENFLSISNIYDLDQIEQSTLGGTGGSGNADEAYAFLSPEGNLLNTAMLTGDFAYMTGPGGWGSAYFSINRPDARLFGSFSVEYFSHSAVSAVPEPAIWALMILGFSLIGISLRKRRSATGSPVQN